MESRPGPCQSTDQVNVLKNAVRSTVLLPGDMAEVGVFQGGTALIIAEESNGKLLHLFDTFTGLPTNHDDGPLIKGRYACPEDRVRHSLRGYNVQFHTGFFPDTAKGLEHLQFSFVHLDGDLYEVTRDGLAFFWPRMVPGGIIVLHDIDLPDCPGISQALIEAGLMDQVIRQPKMDQPHQGCLRKP